MALCDKEHVDSTTQERLSSEDHIADSEDAVLFTTPLLEGDEVRFKGQDHLELPGLLSSKSAQTSSKKSCFTMNIRSIVFLMLGSLTLACILSLVYSNHSTLIHHLTKPSMLSCGNTPAEAAQRGCEFDMMLLAWTPHECFDNDLLERYISTGNWTWQSDPLHEAHVTNLNLVGASSVNRQGVRFIQQDGPGRWVTRWEFHLVHCAYTWELMERAYHRGQEGMDVWVIPDMHLTSVEHAGHCADLWARVARHGIEAEQTYVAKGSVEHGFKNCSKLNDLEGHSVYRKLSVV